MAEITQESLIKEFYINRPNEDIQHAEAVDWMVVEYKKRTDKVFRDPDRGIRKLHQSGFLVKVSKGVYRYDPELVHSRDLEDFTEQQKSFILKRDGYRCAVCGRTKKEGVELQVDHIKPKDKGGRAVLENGQVLCSEHNFRKKNYHQTETGKRMFINLYNLAKTQGDTGLANFCAEILEVFEKNGINGHIVWDK